MVTEFDLATLNHAVDDARVLHAWIGQCDDSLHLAMELAGWCGRPGQMAQRVVLKLSGVSDLPLLAARWQAEARSGARVATLRWRCESQSNNAAHEVELRFDGATESLSIGCAKARLLSMPSVAVVGAGPAGLMAAEMLAANDVQVDLYDAMPSVGRKFLLAGKGGLNLTHSEAFEPFVSRYDSAATWLQPLLQQFGAAELRAWAGTLGVTTFVGSSGRVFPEAMKSAPLLRAWLQRLRSMGVRVHVRHRLLSASCAGGAPTLTFIAPTGEVRASCDAGVLALGGASWPQLGSDGAWLPWLQAAGAEVSALRPANCGFDVTPGWTEHLRSRYAGAPLKGVQLSWHTAQGERRSRLGECVVTNTGLEGSLIYAAAADLREAISAAGPVTVHLDLLAQRDAGAVLAALSPPRGSRSLASVLKSRLGIDGVRASLLYEVLPRELLADPVRLAAAIKALPLRLAAPRPVAEAISTAGGVRRAALDESLMLKCLPGLFCAGEMLDWEAPTGGYLLTACFSTGRAAALGVQRWLERSAQQS